MNAHADPTLLWNARLNIPNYKIRDAARYANLSPQTVASWHSRPKANFKSTLSVREKGKSLSYMQLIEVAVVSSFRKAGVSLKKIRNAREFLSNKLEAEYPFAQYSFKTDGKELWMDYAQLEAEAGDKTLLKASDNGQLAWTDIIGRLQEFEYEKGLAMKWHLAGLDSQIAIDPRIQFGSPSIYGIATWVFRGRWEAGEPLSDIADDFGMPNSAVLEALTFEGIDVGRPLRH